MKARTIILNLLCIMGLTIPSAASATEQDLLPRPRKMELTDCNFQLARPVTLDDATGCVLLKQWLAESGLTVVQTADATIRTEIVTTIEGTKDYRLEGFPAEGYRLRISTDEIVIQALTPTGVTRAAATLMQMAEGREYVHGATIVDWPAFKLRGFMHDTGRSFISVDEIKHEIDLLARFKVNCFHWHLTENQAWRFEVKAFPQLTQPSAMTRFEGQYYTQQECREVTEYAANRGIVVIPEIDMPGHSAAFERAMGFSMQTDEGVDALKTILIEASDVFAAAPYIHIGADEQNITYTGFLDILASHLHALGKRVVMWNPIRGVSITTSTGADMTQMWSTAGKAVQGLPNIDCRYNYANHFDVFADLVGIYKSNIYYANEGNADIAGTISAYWNDRKTPTQRDIINQNNFWANTLASAERAWIGGGRRYIEAGGTVLPNSGTEYDEFADFERRLLHHKAGVLAGEPIPYVKQTNVRWRVTEAFPNGGTASTVLPPESEGLKSSYTMNGQTYGTRIVTGAGIYLRHTWGTTVPATYTNPQSNNTAYAWTYIYSPVEQQAGALIEFQNYGRSENDKAPDTGCWDRKGSRLWLNGTELLPPTWANSGKNINSEVALGNENFTARPAYPITLHKGWNKVFIKLPYVTASGVRLNKWMWTFVVTDTEGNNALDGLVYSPDKELDASYEEDTSHLPTLSTESKDVWYSMCTPLRGNYYATSGGAGNDMTGSTTLTPSGYWKFVSRNDGTLDIINYANGCYVSPASAYNTAIKSVASQPSEGWTLTPVNGRFIITTASGVQLNQTTNAHAYKLFNWGQGTNTTDAGCLYVITEAEVQPTTIPDIHMEAGEREVIYNLSGERVESPLKHGIYIIRRRDSIRKVLY